MTLVKGQIEQEYKETPVGKTTKQGIMVIDIMPSYRIVAFLMHRHRVGLLAFMLVGYIAMDHLGGLSTFGQIIYGTLFGN